MSNCVLDHGRDPTGQPRHATATTGLLCDRHRGRLDDHTTEIGLLIVDSMRIRDGGAPRESSPKTRHLRSADPAAPADLWIMSLYDSRTKANRIAGTDTDPKGDQSEPITNVTATIAELVERVAEERRLTDLPASVLAQLSLLARHHDWIAGQDWVDEYTTQLAELRRGLRAAVRDQPVKTIGTCDLPTDTGVCGGPLLVENGSSVVRCGGCREQWVTPVEQARLSVRLR